jgi:ParB family chromosome partitioning protein
VPGWRIGRHLCTDPDQYGHANVHGTPEQAPTPGQRTAEDEAAAAARQTDERRRVRQRNTEWRAATGTRTSHLKALLGRKAPPAGALKLVVEAMARGETQPQMSSFGHQTACELLGLLGDGAGAGYRDLLLAELARASEKRAQVIALAMVLGAAEHGVRDVHTWQSAEGRYWASYGVPLAARYLTWLAEHTDYALSDIEAEVAAHATGLIASGPSEPVGEAGPGPAQPDDDGDPVTGPGDSESDPEQDSVGQEQTQASTPTS